MTQLTTTFAFVRKHSWLKKAMGTLMLVLLIPGQPVFAQSVPATPIGTGTSAISTKSEPAPAPEPPTVQEVLLDVCKSNGYGQDCAKILLGMLWNESSNRSTVIGDGGRARGYFQIHYKLHKIPVSCAEELVCSANWTLNYMEAHSYPKYVSYAVQCHNSCNVNNGYAAKALRNGKRFWNQPLEVKQAKPIQLAVEK